MKVFVKFDPSYDRIPHPDANLEESINEVVIPFVTILFHMLSFYYIVE